MGKRKATWILLPLRIRWDILESVEALAKLTTKSKWHIIRRAVETYMLYEGADIYDEII
ncbi:hypothetical protein [Rhizobium laguerreae]|uniref:hypothetical protein n=1 Tax=Rhizobium laguerreae TaxID=1076926 RepID=UPI001C914368|nr:hypothetical protein [Rhizobium laguerreae]MBY3556431.1 hypothetical protein [Rhizobium laguerreae]